MKNFHFGENLRMMRHYRGYTQEVMAKNLNMSQGTYSKIEYSKDIPELQLINKLAETLDVKPEALISADWYAEAVNGSSKKSSCSVATISPTGRRAYAILLLIAVWDSTPGAASGAQVESIDALLLIGSIFALCSLFLYHFTIKHVKLSVQDDS